MLWPMELLHNSDWKLRFMHFKYECLHSGSYNHSIFFMKSGLLNQKYRCPSDVWVKESYLLLYFLAWTSMNTYLAGFDWPEVMFRRHIVSIQETQTKCQGMWFWPHNILVQNIWSISWYLSSQTFTVEWWLSKWHSISLILLLTCV